MGGGGLSDHPRALQLGMLIGIDASRSVTLQRTGTEAYAYFLIRSLIAQTGDGTHRLRLYFNQPPPSGLFDDTPHVETCVIPFARLWTHLRLARELRSRPPDVFFTPAHVIPFLYHGPSVATVHDLGYHYFPEAHTRSQVAYLTLSTRSNGRLSKQIIADSAMTKLDLEHYYSLDPQKIQVIYPGLDPYLTRVTDSDLIASTCAKYRIKPPYLLYLGTLQPRKNLKRLTEAFSRSGVPYQLVLGGKMGWHMESLPRTVAALEDPVRERVHLAGYVAENDKAALLSGAEALLYPSLYEGFGFPVLEAQICGAPVLAANSSSLPEITDGSALLVNPLDINEMAEGIQRIVGDDELRKELIDKGYQNVRRFNWDETAAAVLSVLEDVAAG